MFFFKYKFHELQYRNSNDNFHNIICITVLAYFDVNRYKRFKNLLILLYYIFAESEINQWFTLDNLIN